MNKHCSRPALPIPRCCIPRSFRLRGKCPEIWIYFPYFSSRFGFSFFFVSFLWKKHLSPCKVTLLISLCASSHCCLLMYPKDSQSTRDCDASGMSLSVLLPPPLPACNLIYSCDAFFAVWHACSVLICDIIWGSIRVRKRETPCHCDNLYRTVCDVASKGQCNFLIAPRCVADSLWVQFGNCKSCENFI